MSNRLLSRTLALLLCVGGAAASSGCMWWQFEEAYQMDVSRDGSRLAFVHEDTLVWVVPFALVGGPIAVTRQVRWCDVAEGEPELRSAHVDTVCTLIWPDGPVMAFSPDSRHLAVASGRRMVVIDTQTRKKWEVSGRSELVTCLFWSTPEEIIYVARTNVHGDRDTYARSDRTVWRQNIAAPPDTREAISCEKNVLAGSSHYVLARGVSGGYQMEWPSPCGRYLLLVTGGEQGRLTLLDLTSGTTRFLFHCAEFRDDNVAWKPDGSAVFCAAVGGPALLVNTQTGSVQDLSRRFADDLPLTEQLRVEPLWTSDGTYVLVNTQDGPGHRNEPAGYLVRPDPWSIVPLGDLVNSRLPDVRGRRSAVRWFPVAGWAVVLAEGGYYLADYEGQTTVALQDLYRSEWRFSPDGRAAARVDRDEKHVTVRRFALPPPKEPAAPSEPKGPGFFKVPAK